MSNQTPKPPYSCPVTIGGGEKCSYPNCNCSWQLSASKPEQTKLSVKEADSPRDKYIKNERLEYEAKKSDILERMINAKTVEEKAEIKYPFITAEKTGYSYRDTHNFAAKLRRDGFISGHTHALASANMVEVEKVLEVVSGFFEHSPIPEATIECLITQIKNLTIKS